MLPVEVKVNPVQCIYIVFNSADASPSSSQVSEAVESGPYTQLTQEELITLVVKQQTDLSRKDAKIVELEDYIDKLLVRVIEEKPSILHCLKFPQAGVKWLFLEEETPS